MAACSCGTTDATRLAEWRTVCAKFYFDGDNTAKRVLEHFESSKVDQIVIETQSERYESEREHEVRRLIELITLDKCAVPEHISATDAALAQMEKIKNDVRGEYHRYIAKKKYDDFDNLVSRTSGSNYETWKDAAGFQQLLLKVRDETEYRRKADEQSHMLKRIELFVREHETNIGAHPFLAGLRHALEWNLASNSVVAWRVSDAVFVESGHKFADAAMSLLVNVLNFGHYKSNAKDDTITTTHVPFRLWHIDPYMSNNDIKQVINLLPPLARLQARGTGERRVTTLMRMNSNGNYDDHQPFYQRWCVIL